MLIFQTKPGNMLVITNKTMRHQESKWLFTTLDLPGSLLSCDQLGLVCYSKSEGILHNCPPPPPQPASRRERTRKYQWGTGLRHLQRICRAEAWDVFERMQMDAWRRISLGSSTESCSHPCWRGARARADAPTNARCGHSICPRNHLVPVSVSDSHLAGYESQPGRRDSRKC